tara:strand:+ start:3640 stop:3969 length:330 start_codon:yes stop_codon:yes gene_type:complete
MNINLKIQKTDIKVYDINYDIDLVDLKNWVIEKVGTYQSYLDDWFYDEDKGEADPSKDNHTEEDYYKFYVEEYIEDQDIDVVFLDNCNNHSEYVLESEECLLVALEDYS